MATRVPDLNWREFSLQVLRAGFKPVGPRRWAIVRADGFKLEVQEPEGTHRHRLAVLLRSRDDFLDRSDRT